MARRIRATSEQTQSNAPQSNAPESNAQQSAAPINVIIESAPAQPVIAPEPDAPDEEQVMLKKTTFLFGAVAKAGSMVIVPADIAATLRRKGIVV